jgi:hypothetical protein
MNDTLTTATDQSTAVQQLTDAQILDEGYLSASRLKELLTEWLRRGNTVPSFHAGLVQRGWEGSLKAIEAHATAARKLDPSLKRPPSEKGSAPRMRKHREASQTLKSRECSPQQPAPIENDPPASLATVDVSPTTTYDHEQDQLTQLLSGPDGPRPHSSAYLKAGKHFDEGYKVICFQKNDLTSDECWSLRNFLGDCLCEVGIPREAVHQFLSRYQE